MCHGFGFLSGRASVLMLRSKVYDVTARGLGLTVNAERPEPLDAAGSSLSQVPLDSSVNASTQPKPDQATNHGPNAELSVQQTPAG